MRNILFLIFILCGISSNAQDLIKKISGEEISCKVLEITPELVKFKKTLIKDSPIYSLYKTDIQMIVFSDGNKEIFDHSNEKIKIESEYFIDNRDSKKYKIVKIGKQTWFAENLSFEIDNSWCYKKKSEYCEEYGKLYTYGSALKSCPIGWHLPSDNEWKELEIELGMIDALDEIGWRGNSPGQGRLLKKGGSSGFNAEFGGYREDNTFWHVNKAAYFWTSSKYKRSKHYIWFRMLNERASIKRESKLKTAGLSVRCVKDL